MKKLKIQKSNKVALLDNEDYKFIKFLNIKWYISPSGYVYGYFGFNKKYLLHRVLFCLLSKSYKKIHVDHIDDNPLNNQRINLRLCSNKENVSRKKKLKGFSSKYKGVGWTKREQKWRAAITHNFKSIHIGYFKNEIDAAKAYDKIAIELFKGFCRLNFPEFDYSNYKINIKTKKEKT